MVTVHNATMQISYQKEILCASPKQPTYRRYWGRGEKRQGRKDVWSDTESKREVKEIKDIAQKERDEEIWKRERTDTITESIVLKERYIVRSSSHIIQRANDILINCTDLAIISFSLLDECPPLPKTLAGVERKYRQWFLKYWFTSGKRICNKQPKTKY